MATNTQVIVTVTDDIDGSTEGVVSVPFSLDGKDYEIDLSTKNKAKLDKALSPYVDRARRLTRTGKPIRRTHIGPDAKAVRAWAKSAGIDVPAKGRVPQEVVEKFEAAHG